MGEYWNKILNTCAGLLGKMGCRPWILGQPLSSSVYIGIDIGGRKGKVLCYSYVFDQYGRHLGIEQLGPQEKEAIEPDDIRRMIVKIVNEKVKGTAEKLVIHRDRQLAKGEMLGIKQAVLHLIDGERMVKEPVVIGVNLRKTVPFRLYEVKDSEEKGCFIGSYLILDRNRGILATTGQPVLRQGIAKPMLIEAVNIVGEESIENVIKDVYCLAHLNWGSIVQEMKMPVTIKYAEDLVPLVERGIYTRILPL